MIVRVSALFVEPVYANILLYLINRNSLLCAPSPTKQDQGQQMQMHTIRLQLLHSPSQPTLQLIHDQEKKNITGNTVSLISIARIAAPSY